MNIEFLGGCREVGRSCFLVESSGRSVLLDAGVKIGMRQDDFPLLDKNTAQRLDAVILTHAHLDHSAYIPFLYNMGYNGPVYTTKPTRDLVQLLLADYYRISRSVGKACFHQKDLIRMLKNTRFVELREKTKILSGFYLTAYSSGHILGSFAARLETPEKSILYTGDLGFRDTNLLYKADTDIEPFDILMIESTYGAEGDRVPSLKESSRKLAEIIKGTHGKVLIPSFGVGRAQEVMFSIENYVKSGYIPEMPMYLDGMLKKANRIYRHNVLSLREEIPRRILLAEDDPFKSKYFTTPKSKSREDVLKQDRAVIIATSGMLNGGPSLFYFEKLAGNPKNSIVLVGHQAQGTLGRLVQDGEKHVVLPNGRAVDVRANIQTVHMSAHSDRQQLLEYLAAIPKPKKVLIVHGEESKSEDFAAYLRKRKLDAEVPKNGTRVVA